MSTRILPAFVFSGLIVLAASPNVNADSVNWRTNLDAAKIEATESNKLVLLHFYTTTCGPCRMLDENVFSQPQMGDEIERNFVPVKIDAEQSPAIAAAYRVERVPSEIVLTPHGSVVASLSCPQNASEYAGQLTNVAAHFRQHTSNRTAAAQPPVQTAYAGLQVGGYAARSPASQPQPVTPHSPVATNNPYASGSEYSPVASNAYSAPVQTAAVSTGPTMPANAMPNSYRQQGDATEQPLQQTVTTTTPVVQQQVIHNPNANIAGPNTTAQVSPVSHMAAARQLPPGSPPLAFDGYCPVALKSAHKWVAGDLKFGAIHRGRTFLFMGEAQRQQFLANPDAYCPVFSGIDPVLLLDSNQVAEGSRRYGFEYRGAFYLFSNQESMNKFKSQPDQYAAGVRQAMARMDAPSGTGTVLR